MAGNMSPQEEYWKVQADLDLERVQNTADVTGIVDPTPVSDMVSGGVALKRGHYTDAALSALSMIPYAGDAIAKPMKLARNAERIRALEKRAQELQKQIGRGKVKKKFKSTKPPCPPKPKGKGKKAKGKGKGKAKGKGKGKGKSKAKGKARTRPKAKRKLNPAVKGKTPIKKPHKTVTDVPVRGSIAAHGPSLVDSGFPSRRVPVKGPVTVQPKTPQEKAAVLTARRDAATGGQPDVVNVGGGNRSGNVPLGTPVRGQKANAGNRPNTITGSDGSPVDVLDKVEVPVDPRATTRSHEPPVTHGGHGTDGDALPPAGSAGGSGGSGDHPGKKRGMTPEEMADFLKKQNDVRKARK